MYLLFEHNSICLPMMPICGSLSMDSKGICTIECYVIDDEANI